MRIDNNSKAFCKTFSRILSVYNIREKIVGYNYETFIINDTLALRHMWDPDDGQVYKWQIITTIHYSDYLVQELNRLDYENKVLIYTTECDILDIYKERSN